MLPAPRTATLHPFRPGQSAVSAIACLWDQYLSNFRSSATSSLLLVGVHCPPPGGLCTVHTSCDVQYIPIEQVTNKRIAVFCTLLQWGRQLVYLNLVKCSCNNSLLSRKAKRTLVYYDE